MAKGQHLSQYQKKIVNRYYAHLDTIALTKLSELSTELFLSTDAKKAEKLWASAELALKKVVPTDDLKLQVRVTKLLGSRDIRALAQLVSDLSA